jgi:hypothetical protein
MDEYTHSILLILGDGGTTAMAERVRTWIDAGNGGVHPRNIIGFAEVAVLLNLPPAKTRTLIADPTEAFPAPVATLKATDIWDREQVNVWITGHDEPHTEAAHPTE